MTIPLGASWVDNLTNVNPSNINASNINASNVNASNFNFNPSNVNASNVNASNVNASNVNASNVNASNTNLDVSDIRNGSKLDFSDAATKEAFVDSLKKLESDFYTTNYGNTVESNSWYKANKTKLAAAGFTLAVMAAWYGSLLGQGYSPEDALKEQQDTAKNFFKNAINAAIKAAWNTFIQLLHDSFGYRFFDDVEGTERALKFLITFLILQKILGFFGVNLITLPFKLVGGILKPVSQTSRK